MEISEEQRLRAEVERLRAENSQLKHIIASTPTIIYWKDKDGVYLGCNVDATRKVNSNEFLTHDQCIIGKTDYDIFPKEMADRYREHDLTVMHSKQESSFEEAVNLSNGGTQIQLSIKKPLCNNKGNVIGIIGSTIDITKIKAMHDQLVEERNSAIHDLEYIISKIPGYIYWKNTKSQYMGCNEQLAKFSKLNKSSDIKGKTDFDFEWGRVQAEQFVKDDQYIMETGEMLVTEYELPQRRGDGKKLFVHTEKMPFYNKDGKINGILAIAFDITDQKELERRLIVEKNNAEKSGRVKTEFMRNMEHDIRTPLSGISGLASYLLHKEASDEKKEYLTTIIQ